MKTKEELNAIREEVETLNGKLAELSAEETAQVFGGTERARRARKIGKCPQCHIEGRENNSLYRLDDMTFCREEGHIFNNGRFVYKNKAEIINIPCEG